MKKFTFGLYTHISSILLPEPPQQKSGTTGNIHQATARHFNTANFAQGVKGVQV